MANKKTQLLLGICQLTWLAGVKCIDETGEMNGNEVWAVSRLTS